MEPTLAEIRAAKIAKPHKAISGTILKHLSNLYEILANGDVFIEDPRVESELEIIINLEGASSTLMPDFDEIKKKDERDKNIKDALTEMDIIIFYLRKYRIFLHQLAGDVVVDPNVLDTAKDVLKELYRHTAHFEKQRKEEEERKMAQKVKALVLKSRKEREVQQLPKSHIEKILDEKSGSKDDDDHQVQSEEPDDEATRSDPPSHDSREMPESQLKSGNTLDEKYKAYEAPTGEEQQNGEGEDEEFEAESEEDEEKEFFAERERTLQNTLHTLEKFTDGLGKHSRLLEVILYQIDCILRVTKGQVDDEWEVKKANEDVQKGHEDGLEETVLDQLKNYRVMLQVQSKVSTKDDAELLKKIVETKKAILLVRPELKDQESSSTVEEVPSTHTASDDGNESDQETTREPHRLITGGISCSCGHICQLALQRPMTPESELSEGEREQREWYEDNQTILKNYALPIVGFLKLYIKDTSAGKVIDPTILTYAKMIMDVNKGTMRKIEIDEELDGLIREARQDITSLTLKQQFINYYYLVLDPEIELELDESVIDACFELLEAVSKGSSEDNKQERLDPDELCFDR